MRVREAGDTTGRRRAAWGGLAVVVVLLLADAVMLPWRFPLPSDPIVAHTVPDAAIELAPPRAHSVIVAMAAREVALPGEPHLWVPEDLEELLDIAPEEVGSRYEPTISASLMGPMIGQRVTVEEYDPVLDGETVDRLMAQGPREFDRAVFVLEGDGVSEFRLYVGPERRRVFLVPVDSGLVAE